MSRGIHVGHEEKPCTTWLPGLFYLHSENLYTYIASGYSIGLCRLTNVNILLSTDVKRAFHYAGLYEMSFCAMELLSKLCIVPSKHISRFQLGLSYSLISIEYCPLEFSRRLYYNLSVERKIILLVRDEKLMKIKEFSEQLRMKEFFF